MKHSGRRLLPRSPACTGPCVGVFVFAVALTVCVFGGAAISRYAREKAERAFAKAYPGYALRMGDLVYAVGANRLVARSVTVSGTDTTLKADRISLTGVRWVRLFWGGSAATDVLARARLEAANIEMRFPRTGYRIRCKRLQGSVPDSEAIAVAIELRSLAGDERFFGAHESRTTRLHAVVPRCTVSGLAYGELLQGESYRARWVRLSRPSLEVLDNCDKPPRAFVESPPMLHEVLAAIPKPLRVDRLSITNGHLSYCKRVNAGAAPGVLTFAEVSMSVNGIANRGNGPAAMRLQAQGNFMDAGVLKVLMSVPIASPDLSLHYSGSLGAMDLTRLNAYLEIAEHTRIESGSVQEASFDIDVRAGQARGRVRAIYSDLVIAVLDKQTGTEEGLDNRVASFLLNTLRIRNANHPDASGAMEEGEVNYTRQPEDGFLPFAWFALRSGLFAVIGR